MKKIFTLIFIAMMLLQLVSAEIVVNKQVCNFALSSSSIDMKACAGSEVEVPITVDNVGDVEALFEVHILSKQANWFSVDRSSFNLKPGEAANTIVRIRIPFGWEGNVDYTIKVVTREFGREKEIHRSLEIVRCQSISVQKPASTLMCPAELSTSSFILSNPAPFADSYVVSVDEFEEFVTLSDNNFNLASGEEAEVFVYTRFPPSMWGEFQVPLTITSESNGMSKTITSNVKVKKAYDFGVEVESTVFACNLVEKTVPIVVKNNKVACDNGGVENTFNLNLNGPGFVELSEDSVTLAPGEEAVVFATVDSQGSIGSFDAELEITSEFGDLVSTRSIALDVGDCYNHDLNVQEQATVICKEGQEKTFDVNVRNLGLNNQDVMLTLAAEPWAHLETNMVDLRPNENKNVELVVQPVCADQSYEIVVKSQDTSIEEVNDEASMILDVVTQRTAYQLELLQHNFDLKHNAKVLNIPVRNTGIVLGTYAVASESMFLEPENHVITLDAGETKNLVMVVGDVSGLEPGEYLHNLVFLEKSSGMVYETTIGTNLIGPGFATKAFNWLMDNLVHSKWFIIIGLCGWSGILLLIAFLALVNVFSKVQKGEIKTKRFKVSYRTNFNILKTVLLLLVACSLVWSVATFDTERPEFFEPAMVVDNPLMLQWGQDTTLRLNLDNYFVDPDGDVLVYNSMGAEHVEVLIDANQASLTPDFGWSGSDSTVFTATDEAGETTNSKKFALNVLQKNHLSWWDYWLANCLQVNAFIMGLIFLMVLLLVTKVEPHSKKHLAEVAERAAVTRAKKAAAAKRKATLIAKKRAEARARNLLKKKRKEAARKAALTRKRNARKRK